MKVDINKVKVELANKCMSVNELVEKTGLGRTTVSKIINGNSEPSIKTVGLIVKALNIKAEDIVKDL